MSAKQAAWLLLILGPLPLAYPIALWTATNFLLVLLFASLWSLVAGLAFIRIYGWESSFQDFEEDSPLPELPRPTEERIRSEGVPPERQE
jgi:hypothetical protein